MGYWGNTVALGRLGELAQVLLGASESGANLKPYRTTHNSPNAPDTGRTAATVARGKRPPCFSFPHAELPNLSGRGRPP